MGSKTEHFKLVNSANYMQQAANAPPYEVETSFSSADVVFSSVMAFYTGLAAGIAVAATGFWLF